MTGFQTFVKAIGEFFSAQSGHPSELAILNQRVDTAIGLGKAFDFFDQLSLTLKGPTAAYLQALINAPAGGCEETAKTQATLLRVLTQVGETERTSFTAMMSELNVLASADNLTPMKDLQNFVNAGEISEIAQLYQVARKKVTAVAPQPIESVKSAERLLHPVEPARRNVQPPPPALLLAA